MINNIKSWGLFIGWVFFDPNSSYYLLYYQTAPPEMGFALWFSNSGCFAPNPQ